MRLRDALKLGLLIALYSVSVALAHLFESKIARRVWRVILLPILLPIAGFAVLLFIVVQIPCEHTIHDTVTVPMRDMRESPALNSSLPFVPELIPVRNIGDPFDYGAHFGYQVPSRFDFGPSIEWGRIMSARLALNGHMHTPNDRVRHDLSLTNHTFFERLDDCCRRRRGWAELGLDELLAQEKVLEDDRVDVVIADDTELMAAELEICSAVGPLVHCRTACVSPDESSVETRARLAR